VGGPAELQATQRMAAKIREGVSRSELRGGQGAQKWGKIRKVNTCTRIEMKGLPSVLRAGLVRPVKREAGIWKLGGGKNPKQPTPQEEGESHVITARASR